MANTARIPWFGARKVARQLAGEVHALTLQCEEMREQLAKTGSLSLYELDQKRAALETEITQQRIRLQQEQREAVAAVEAARATLLEVQKTIVVTEELALLQEAGVYKYRHPLTDAVAYQKELAEIEVEIREMTRKDGGAVVADQKWSVNGSEVEGRKMVRDFSKLLLRAFNAEADNLVRALKPHKLNASIERLHKVAATIEKLGKTMHIRISTPYEMLRIRELQVTADFLQKQAEEKEAERLERERLKEERKVQQEMERERARLEKERQHFQNALAVLEGKGEIAGVERLRLQLDDVQRAIADVDYRAANIRAGYVYVISNIGSFGERMIKVGLTRRLDPLDRIRELSDASVPFNFDVHALFFSKDAVGIEAAMHERLAGARVNTVNRRREFFGSTPAEAKAHLTPLTGEMLEFCEIPEAIEYRQCMAQRAAATSPSTVSAKDTVAT
jgi:hypothetical protein